MLHARFQRNKRVCRAEQEAILKGEVRRGDVILPARLIEQVHIRADIHIGAAVGHKQDFRHPGITAVRIDDGELGKVRRDLINDHGRAVAGIRAVASARHEQQGDAFRLAFFINGVNAAVVGVHGHRQEARFYADALERAVDNKAINLVNSLVFIGRVDARHADETIGVILQYGADIFV